MTLKKLLVGEATDNVVGARIVEMQGQVFLGHHICGEYIGRKTDLGKRTMYQELRHDKANLFKEALRDSDKAENIP